MENKENTKPNWWQTAPGILTAVAALLTATGGLLLTFNQVGCFDKSATKNKEVIQTPSENKDTKQIQPESNDNSKNGNIENKTSNISNKKYPITLPPDISDLKIGDFTIKFIETSLDNYSTGKLSLTFKIRITNKSNSSKWFGNYLFRILFDGQILSPEESSLINAHENVPAISSKDGDIVFVIPNTIKSAELQISYVDDEKQTTKIPINLNSK
jgi:hypothetical protein